MRRPSDDLNQPPSPEGDLPSPSVASISAVVPVFNAEAWVAPTLSRISEALQEAEWGSKEIVAVNDGSTDGTAGTLEDLRLPISLRVVHQVNKGRLLARKRGIDEAAGDYVLLMDIRVFPDSGSLRFVTDQLTAHPDRQVWNGHVELERKGNPYGRFWHAVSRIAWRRYLSKPRLMSYTDEDFDYFPKGTGCFLAPRKFLLDAYESFISKFDDLEYASDDTALIRQIARRTPIYLSPEFSFVYHARETFRGFLHHAYVRGVHFVDGHLDPTNRFFVPLILFLVASPLAVAAVLLWPSLLFSIPLILTIELIVVLGLRISMADSLALTALTPPFTLVYGAGIWKGLYMAFRTLLHRKRTAIL